MVTLISKDYFNDLRAWKFLPSSCCITRYLLTLRQVGTNNSIPAHIKQVGTNKKVTSIEKSGFQKQPSYSIKHVETHLAHDSYTLLHITYITMGKHNLVQGTV